MIQSIHKGVEIELESHQLTHGMWRCDYTLITHPGRVRTFHQGDKEFPTKDQADEYALQQARNTIDRDFKSLAEDKIENPPRQVDI
jgi:hypothetical protein